MVTLNICGHLWALPFIEFQNIWDHVNNFCVNQSWEMIKIYGIICRDLSTDAKWREEEEEEEEEVDEE